MIVFEEVKVISMKFFSDSDNRNLYLCRVMLLNRGLFTTRRNARDGLPFDDCTICRFRDSRPFDRHIYARI